ncbi:MAG: hypothetical protein WCG03_10205, partial [Kiritimatiellales bacterium]
QIAGAAAKKNQPRPPANAREEPEPSVDPFAELLRKMAGVQTFEVPQPEYEEALTKEMPWTPGPSHRNGMKAADLAALPDIKPLRRASPEAPAPISVSPKIDVRPKMSAFRSSVPSIRLPTLHLSFQGSATALQNSPNLGKILNSADTISLRRAMLSHIIFSPPKALSRTSE